MVSKGDPMIERELLQETLDYAARFLGELGERRVGTTVALEELRQALGGPLPEEGRPARDVIAHLTKAADPGIVATTSGRFFGFVIGGALPAAVAADWLTTTWDQNAGLYAAGPAASVVEEIGAQWLKELFGLPEEASTGFVTGGQMANFTGLAAARQHVLAQAGWDDQRDGLQGAPRITVLAGEERHATIDRALRFLGLGTASLAPLPADDQGRLLLQPLAAALKDREGPTIVCAQAGNVNSGSFDPIGDICQVAHDAGAWVHVDGAFGLWAAASPQLRHLVSGIDAADSWATDAHKWLNVPYDSGLVFCAHPDSHREAMSVHASYLVHGVAKERDQMDWNPEFSRRARGFTVYAAIQALGRAGIVEMVERCCSHARRFADELAAVDGVEVLNDVVLNQVLVRFGDDDATTKAVVDAVQQDGTCWLSGSVWKGKQVMRISVSNWSTTTEDVDRSLEAILRSAGVSSR